MQSCTARHVAFELVWAMMNRLTATFVLSGVALGLAAAGVVLALSRVPRLLVIWCVDAQAAILPTPYAGAERRA